MMQHIRRYIFAGLLVWLPIWATLLVLRFIINLLDGTMSLLPKGYQPEHLFGYPVPGLGVVFSILILILTGVLASNFLGKRLVGFGEAIVNRIPLVRSIYMATKQVLETLFSSGSQSFRQVFLIEYPRPGSWAVAFQTGNAAREVEQKLGCELITVFIPTTPNPTSGFLMMIPKSEAIALDMSVDQALKFVISLGVVPPIPNNKCAIEDTHPLMNKVE